jgi:type II secretory ATPase GspE/PulE/Tfp pilus assembly ATPase PilB-like protein
VADAEKRVSTVDTAVHGTKAAPRKGLGEMLVEAGMITSEQLDKALELEHKGGHKLRDILVEEAFVTPEDIAMVISLRMNVPFIDLKFHSVQQNALKLVSEQTARKHTLIPLDVVGDSLIVVMADPGDLRALEDVNAQAKMRVQPAVGIRDEIREAIDLNYKVGEEIERQMQEFAPPAEDVEAAEEIIAKTPIVRTVDLLVTQAVKERASDIHIEPQKDRVRIRVRIDGVLHDTMSLPLATLEPLVTRVKILAGMNITEQRRPQDGQCSFKVEGRDVDIRVATCDTAHGETVVLRILDKSLAFINLSELGFLPEALRKHKEMLRSPYGMLLVAGPTGSGKTTTLYASVNQLDRNERNVMTIEDPIEYHFDDVKQTQVNVKAGITFASGLRAIMRLDPDVIFVGEIRDTDTAKTAIQAALTGHLVLSSIHANDAVGVLFRLIDLGVEPYLITSAMVGTVAQRMVRRICPHCSEPYQPSPEELAAYEAEMGPKHVSFLHGAGCNLCSGTGYLRRTGVFEVLPLSEESRRLLLKGVSGGEIKAQALMEGMIPIRRDGMLKVRDGITTPQEVLRNVFSIG